MDKLKEKISNIRLEADAAAARADAAELALKQLNEQQNEREQEIISLQNRISLLEDELDRKEAKISEAKKMAEDVENSRDASDVLTRRINIVEEKLEAAESELQESKEKLRNMDIKTESLERTIVQLENERAESDVRYEELNEKYLKSKADLEETMKFLEDMRAALGCFSKPAYNFSKVFHTNSPAKDFPPVAKSFKQSDPTLSDIDFSSTGINPTINQILKKHKAGDEVTVYGWVTQYRKQKSICFLKISDGSLFRGLQAVISFDPQSPLPERIVSIRYLMSIFFYPFHSLNLACSVQISGILAVSPGKNQDLELQASKISVLGKTDPKVSFKIPLSFVFFPSWYLSSTIPLLLT
ncbi:Tropomyosin-2 [Smittium mucronatum]|uniref:Tropomyosin-2 n=1 Tax=Smittium mucronatum TaxID=133383 RepID=A0A1R0GS36_9FUNG|nr:Tropomyosin-2 [Smittium mucronatum]